ncbi:MAG TPA: dimethylmenaquinone methyltransferase [Polyangia bacterium]|nr:dimethylmenaquinone methyltransferase [Polyangia bacterium]
MIDQFAAFGTATVHESFGRDGIVDLDLIQVVPGSRVAGPARTVLCAQGDNTSIHAALAEVEPGEVLAVTMPEPEPYGAIGELLALQAKAHGVAGILIDLAVRDREDLVGVGLPIWARWVRARGTEKGRLGTIGGPITIGGRRIETGDLIVMDADGAVVVPRSRIDDVFEAARAREAKEDAERPRYAAGELSWDLLGLRELAGG